MARNTKQATTGRGKTPTVALCALAAALAVSGCNGIVAKDERQTYDGFFFRTKSAPVDKKTNPESFVVQVSNATQSIEAAGKAAHHEGVRYCIERFGPHQIKWAVDPLAEPEALQLSKGTMIVKGACLS